jgi:riboflavin synthase
VFTGLIMEMGEIVSLQKRKNGGRLSLTAPAMSKDAGIGDSISINGTCLTVVDIKDKMLAFDLSGETLKSTNLGLLRPGDKVNLESSLRFDSKLGGHFVTGHIDGVGTIRSRERVGDVLKFVIFAEEHITDFLVEKGSVALDGISLTVVDLLGDGFSVVIIPHTAKMTTLGFKGAGDTVNLEVDILGKYVSKFLGKNKDSRFMQTLIEGGFA